MKKYYVYKIKEKKSDKVVYIGQTGNPYNRWAEHKGTNGLYNSKLYYMDVIDEYPFENKKDSINYQCELQKEYGFKTDLDKLKFNAVKGAIEKYNVFVKTGKSTRPVNAYDYHTGKFVGSFYSTRDAQRKLNVSNINKVLHNLYKQVGGYYFEYKQ